MKDILNSIIINLVENKESVSITETEKEDETLYEVVVAEADKGRVIGKQGRVAKSIRTVMRAIAFKEKKNIYIKFVD